MLAAEWAIARLQAEAAFQLEAMQSAASGSNDDEESTAVDHVSTANSGGSSMHDREHPGTPIGRYHCTSRNRHGNLIVTTQDVSFKQHLTKDRSWRLRYDQMKAIQKVRHPLLLPLQYATHSPILYLYLIIR